VFKPYLVPAGTIRINDMASATNCKGFNLGTVLACSKWHTFPVVNHGQEREHRPDLEPVFLHGDGVAWWLTYGVGCKSGPVSLSNDYSSQPGPAAPRLRSTRIRAPTDAASGTRAESSAGQTRIRGSIRMGTPREVISSLSAPRAVATYRRDTSSSVSIRKSCERVRVCAGRHNPTRR
jgi:hypothetical protein